MTAIISVIIPAYNAASTLQRCLHALQLETDDAKEVILVDDCSTDETFQIARSMEARILQTPARGGPAGARNLGALHATGEILFFIDADVVIQKGSISLVRHVLEQNPDVSAVFGSYDEDPAEQNFLSQYKNLLHHYVHQQGAEEAGTFWAGCGAIRKHIFESVHGFDSQKYPHPSIEDIELGIRLKQQNYKIRLEKRLQGKHLKKWTVRSLLTADILHRAFPWSKLIAVTGKVPNDLNLQRSHRVSSMLSAAFFLALMITILFPSWWILLSAVLFLGLVILLNRDLYAFFLRKKGILFLSGAIFWHMIYYVYSAIVFVYCWIRFGIFRSREAVPSKIERIV